MIKTLMIKTMVHLVCSGPLPKPLHRRAMQHRVPTVARRWLSYGRAALQRDEAKKINKVIRVRFFGLLQAHRSVAKHAGMQNTFCAHCHEKAACVLLAGLDQPS
jgi:hypothetical protein